MLFERVAHGRKGIAVAEARDGLCTCATSASGRRSSTRCAGTTVCTSATAARGSSISSLRRATGAGAAPCLRDHRMIVAYIDGGARRGTPGRPGTAAHRGGRRYRPRRVARRAGRRHQQRRGVQRPARRAAVGRRPRPAAGARPRRFGAARQADARGVPRKEPRSPAAVQSAPAYSSRRSIRSCSSTCAGSATRKPTACPTSGWTLPKLPSGNSTGV